MEHTWEKSLFVKVCPLPTNNKPCIANIRLHRYTNRILSEWLVDPGYRQELFQAIY